MSRPRAPTITIDTSAVGDTGPPDEPVYTDAVSESPASPKDERHSGTFSPHNISSPPTSSHNNYLSVPAARSRTDSRGSVDTLQSATLSGETFAGLINDVDALRPDPGTESEFDIEDNKFAFSPGQMSKLFNPKSYAAFHALGGLKGLEVGLRTDVKSGLRSDEGVLADRVSFEDATGSAPNGKSSPDKTGDPPSYPGGSDNTGTFADRKRVFKDNRIPARKTKNIFQLMWQTFNDKVLILLSIAALISLAIGIYQSIDTARDPNNHEAPIQWVEGVAIIVAVVIVVLVGSLNDFQKEHQFAKLNKKKDDREVNVIRSGRQQAVSVYDILSGDVMQLEPGDIVPADGIFIDGHNITCDESSATGESDLMKKTKASEVYRALENHESVKKLDCFILSGSKVTEGVGTFLTTATGVYSTHGRTLMSLQDEGEVTPLQSKLNVLATQIAKLGATAALLYFIGAFIRFLVDITSGADRDLPAAQKGQEFLQIFIVAVSVIVVAVPEGLPLAVTLALAFATTRMMKENNLVRLLRSCETMGNATTICSDKTGTLTQNRMSVVKYRVGQVPTKSHEEVDANTDVDLGESKSLVQKSIALNSTAFENKDGEYVGSKTETALLDWARDHLHWGDQGTLKTMRTEAKIAQVFPFDSGRKCMATVEAMPKGYRMYVKGASEVLLERCTHILAGDQAESKTKISEEQRKELLQLISTWASNSLRTIALLYRDFDNWPSHDLPAEEFDSIFKDMTFVGIVGIQDPLRPGVAEAVASCQSAGVTVRMVTGDNVQTARAIATDCGIFHEGTDDLVLEGPAFRRMGQREMDDAIPRLRVLARSSPEDKRVLTKRLKALGETVAVTGDGTNDAPSLKAADVGFSMGIAGTEVAKEASAIILMDDNFASIVRALMWGRTVNDAVKKFLQFQITVNITAVLLTFVSGLATPTGEPVLTAVQLLWVNLIMDTLAALALATDPPSDSVLNRLPDRKSAPLISVTMWKMIVIQAVFQLTTTLVLFFHGAELLGLDPNIDDQQSQLRTTTFNVFVWMQIFGAFNSRRLDNRLNIFEGIQRNLWFIGILAVMIGGQVVIIFKGGAALDIHNGGLTAGQWGVSIVAGFVTIPIGVLVRFIPDGWILRAIPQPVKDLAARRRAKVAAKADEEQVYHWNPALAEIKEELVFLKKFRGGRLNALKFRVQHPRQSGLLPSRSSSANRSRSSTVTSAALAGVVAGSVAGWSPTDHR